MYIRIAKKKKKKTSKYVLRYTYMMRYGKQKGDFIHKKKILAQRLTVQATLKKHLNVTFRIK